MKLHAELYAPLDFLGILGCLNKLPPPGWVEHIPKFHGHPHLAAQHVTSFIDFILDLYVVHEDVIMRMFAHTMEESADYCFKSLGRGEISSFAGFIKAFRKYWDNNYEEE